MELFPAQPNLSLQISPPNNKPSSSWSSRSEESMDLGFWKRSLEQSNNTKNSNSTNNTSSKAGGIDGIIDLSLAYPTATSPSNPNHHHHHHHPIYHDLTSMKPIRGIPLYHTSPNYSFQLANRHYNRHQYYDHYSSSSSSTSNTISASTPFGVQSRSRFLSRYPPPKRTMRAPRMRWTTTLHARFVHAVELLGGHERATPKSVLELMDVKDLTLAHVKSHLQMYRTVKTTDRHPTSSDQNNPIEISDDNLLDIRGPESMAQNGKLPGDNSTNHCGLWSNSSSRGNWLHDKPKDFFNTGSLPSVVNDMRSKRLEEISDLNSSCVLETSAKMLNLEFTLGPF